MSMLSEFRTLCSRRFFLKLAASTAGVALLPSMPLPARAADEPVIPFRKVKGFCHLCQSRCTYHALVDSTTNKIVSFLGDKENRWTGGSMCAKGLAVAELIDSKERLTSCMKRTESGWVTISYDEALTIIADKIREVQKTHGKKAGSRMALTEPLWDCRESEIAALMTMRQLGCANIMPPGEVCISTSAQTQGMLFGSGASSTTVNEILNAKTLIIWGANICDLYPPYSRWLQKARDAGVKMIYIDCRKTPTAQWCSHQLMPAPGTDGALALGALRHVIVSGAYNAEKLANLSTGFDTLKDGAMPWTVDKVAAVTGLSVAEITGLYATIAASPATVVWLGGALCRYTNGMTTVRAIASLQVLTDNMIGKGRGILNMQGGKPEGHSEFIDEVCGKATAKGVNFRRLNAAMKKGNIDILFLNSSYRRYPACNAVAAAIKKVPLVVHRGYFMTEEMDVADIFIPASFGPESDGSHYTLEKSVVWREKALNAPEDCVPCWQFYRDLGMKLAPKTYPQFKNAADLYEQLRKMVPSWRGMGLANLQKSPDGMIWPRYHEGDAEQIGCHFRQGKYLTADGKVPFALPVLGPLRWDYPKGSPLAAKKGDDAFPLILVQAKNAAQWQQTLGNFTPSLSQFSQGRTVTVHPETAARYALQHGEMVVLETPVGGIWSRVVIDESAHKQCVVTEAYMTESSPFKNCRSPHINSIVPNYWDRVSAQFNGSGCRLVKI